MNAVQIGYIFFNFNKFKKLDNFCMKFLGFLTNEF